MRVTIDRFEGEYAICEKEDRNMINIEKSQIPSDVKEGDVLLIEGSKITFDKSETERRRKAISDLMNNLWN